MISRNIIGRVGRVDYPAQADDYFTRVANIYVEVSPLGVATAERRAADGAQCVQVPGPFLLRMTFTYYVCIEFRFSSRYFVTKYLYLILYFVTKHRLRNVTYTH